MAIRYLSGINVDSNTLFVDSANNRVGIGTGSPGRKLTVQGADDGTMQLRLMGTASQNSYWEIGREAASTGQFRFVATRTGTTIIPMVINDINGRVGIGTTSPEQQFHLQGSNLMATFQNSDTSANQYTQVEFVAGSRTAYIWLGNQNSSSWAGDGGLNIYTTSGNMDLWTAANQRMRITSSGNVLIGTTTDAGFKLTVSGNGTFISGAQSLSILANATWATNFLKSDMAASAVAHIFGKANSTNNSATLRYYHAADASASSYIGLGFYSNDDLFRLYTGGDARLTSYGSGTFTGTVAYNLAVDASGNIIETAGGVVDGSGTANKISKWQDANTLTDANITDNGSTVRINSLPLMADSRLAVGTAGADQTYASVFIGGNLTEGSSQYALLLDPQLDGTTNYGMLSNARIAANVTATTAYGIYQFNNELLSGATVENNFGIYIANQTSGTTQNWNLYSVTGKNYFGGNVLIGTTTDAGQKLQVSGQSSLKLGSGTTQQTIVTFDNATNGAYLSVVGIGTTSVVGTWTNGSMVLEAVPFSTGSFILGAYTGSTIIQNGRVNRVEVSSAGAVRFNNYGSGTFTGTPAYNLGVDSSGNVIELPGGVVDGSGTANYVTKWQDANTVTNSSITDDGSTVTALVNRVAMNQQAGIYVFPKSVGASASAGVFEIKNTHGAQALRVAFVCSTSGYSVAKTYEVVHCFAQTPIYSKVVDTGPFSGEDFNVAFTNNGDNTGLVATITNNSTTLTANIVATVFLGGSSTTIIIIPL